MLSDMTFYILHRPFDDYKLYILLIGFIFTVLSKGAGCSVFVRFKETYSCVTCVYEGFI